MPSDSPLIQALQAKQGDLNDPQALLEFILSRFTLTPKDEPDEEEPIVTTQESHAP